MEKVWSYGRRGCGVGLGVHPPGSTELSLAVAIDEDEGCCINLSLFKYVLSVMWFWNKE